MEEIKFTQEELNTIAELQKKYGEITYRFGQLYLEKTAIERRMTQNAVDFDNTTKELEDVQKKEQALAATFQLKYGEGQLNPVTGVFTPASQLPPNVKS